MVPSAHRLLTEKEEAYVFLFCKSGRHRSVANADLMSRAIFDLYDVEGVELGHLCDGPNWKHTCAGKCVDCQWENPLTRPLAEEAVKLARQLWKEVVLEAGDRLPEPGGSAAADKEEKAARAEPASGSKDKPGDSSGSTERPGGDPSEGTKQSVDVGKQKSQDFECWDLRSSMKEMSDDQLKKVAFLFLSRIYSVFDPQKQGSSSRSMRWTCGRYRSLDLALAYMEADDEEDATKKQKLKEALEESRKKKSESERDRTRTPTREPAKAPTDTGDRTRTPAREPARASTDTGKGVGEKGGRNRKRKRKGCAERKERKTRVGNRKTTQRPDRTSWS